MRSATIKRCSWVSVDDPLMLQYHDREWGVPVHDDRKDFEFLVLEGAQAGLSWTIVLKKREGYRRAFDEFDPEKVARFSARRIETLALDSAIIRNRMKIEAAVRNARISQNPGRVRKFRLLLLAFEKCARCARRSEEHTSELQSPDHLVCRLLLEKKKINQQNSTRIRI